MYGMLLPSALVRVAYLSCWLTICLVSRYATDINHAPKTCTNNSVPLCSLSNLQLRFLCPKDLPEVSSYKYEMKLTACETKY